MSDMSGSGVESGALATESPVGMDVGDPAFLQQSSPGGVPEDTGLTGTDLASFALSRSGKRMSASDLDRLGLALIQQAVQDRDFRAAASTFSALVSLHKSSVKAATTKVERRGLDKALGRAFIGRNRSMASRQVVDAKAELAGPDGPTR